MDGKTRSGTCYLKALTMIDPATGWFEVVEVEDFTADCMQVAFDEAWLCRYPRPEILHCDGGTEFKGEFEAMRLNYGMKRADISAYNPQSNGIIERVHLVMGDHIRVMELQNEEVDKTKPFHSMLHTVAYAIRSTYHTTLHASPAQLVYGRDMFLPIKFKAN